MLESLPWIQSMSLLLHRINSGSLSDGLRLLPRNMDSLRARALLLTIGLQESRFLYRRQMVGSPPRPVGPAVSFYQFETGGIRGLLTHRATKAHVQGLCKHFGLPPTERAIWEAMKTNDDLGAAVARLNLWWATDPLPEIDDVDRSWLYYLNCWRPGAVKRDPEGLRAKWGRNHTDVLAYLRDPA